VSCGVATVTDPTGFAPRELLHAADTALYAAKAAGRNCVSAAPPLYPSSETLADGDPREPTLAA
jgi:hypothetical protein